MRVVLNFMAGVQLGPVKKRFIGVASWLRGRDVQIALIKNPPRALLRKRGLSELPLAKHRALQSITGQIFRTGFTGSRLSLNCYTTPNNLKYIPNNYTFNTKRFVSII